MTSPVNTPNVVIESPKARRIARTTLDVVGVLLGTLLVIDAAAPEFDVAAFTTPVLAGWTYLRLAFGLGVDNPNTPKA
ncbi:hypothetical protein [Microbacterium sp. No. 7]|uniref:hypothetical protein n=1 Tax=Microbacterium sp. No. 7 TaxID=1714373 RepID=UPI0006CF5601|nr:hypothetical protein [Microbacterium sp. No. 7]ALJ22033.1 hypothetical protein AOA12_19915 [Microbacterium sp. No. 7]